MISTALRISLSALRSILMVINNMYTALGYCSWMLLLKPIEIVNKDLYWNIETVLYDWLLGIVSSWCTSAGYNIIEMGDVLTPCLTGKTLILVNHQSTADVPILMSTFHFNHFIIKRFMWIMDWIFCLTHFGLVSKLHGDFFILSGYKQRDEAIKALKNHISKSFVPSRKQFIVVFPEAGFLRKRRERSKRYAIEHNLSNSVKNVALPRTGAVTTIIETLKFGKNNSGNDGHLKWILDITIAYEDGRPLDLVDIVTRWRYPCTTYLFYRIFSIAEVPDGEPNILQWLYNLWEEKDKILDLFYANQLPLNYSSNHKKGGQLLKPQLVQQSFTKLLFVNVFFILSSYLHIKLVIYIISSIW